MAYATETVKTDRRNMDKTIWVTFDKPGIHRYPDAPNEVAYLRNEHRHIFKFKVTITVHHDDREIEFHMMKNRLVALYDQSEHYSLQLNHKSCEMLAQELHDRILDMYDCTRRLVAVCVSEDGECGAEVCSFGKRSLDNAPRPDNVPGAVPVTQQVGMCGDNVMPSSHDVLNPYAAWPFPVAPTKGDGMDFK